MKKLPAARVFGKENPERMLRYSCRKPRRAGGVSPLRDYLRQAQAGPQGAYAPPPPGWKSHLYHSWATLSVASRGQSRVRLFRFGMPNGVDFFHFSREFH